MSEVVYLDLCCLKLVFGPLDALHAAFAEEAGARWLVTTDDQLIALGHGDYTVERGHLLAGLTLEQAIAEIRARQGTRDRA